jgi:pimeloyl-ACP methyl ester carboxylesterase
MAKVSNRGIRINYRTMGQGEPLVLIHGWSGEGRQWDECGYVGQLSGEFQVILPDLRGHGESDMPANGDFTDAAFASDVIAVLDDQGIDSAHVFGYSLGG